MRFVAAITIVPGQIGIDPVATPGDVPDTQLLLLPSNVPRLTKGRTLLVLEGDDPVETVDIVLWALNEDTGPKTTADDPTAGRAQRLFYQLGTVIAPMPVSTLFPVPNNLELSGGLGTVYVQVTANLLVQPRRLLAAVV